VLNSLPFSSQDEEEDKEEEFSSVLEHDHGWQIVLQFFVELENGVRDRR
jgi:hypothetical protein